LGKDFSSLVEDWPQEQRGKRHMGSSGHEKKKKDWTQSGIALNERPVGWGKDAQGSQGTKRGKETAGHEVEHLETSKKKGAR